MNNFDPDIQESLLLERSPELLAVLLKDNTTGSNIRWCTHDYEHLGASYGYNDELKPERITGNCGNIIKPRVLKTKAQQSDRVKDMAEVFTPSWVVRIMVDNVEFDIETRCLELTCGEAPFLVSRYDATSGEPIPISERVGVLDHKLRLINDKQLSDEEWLAQVRQAFQSTYGYEWQGDSLLLARENLLYAFVDHYEARFNCKPDLQLLLEYAEIISWNLWQMDGLTYRIPQEKKEQPQSQFSLFDDAPVEVPAPFCIIMDWRRKKTVKVNDIKQRQTKNHNIMKFDVIIGNPPYQEEMEGTSDSAIYNYFMDEAYRNGRIVELVTPARWLFDAGKTKKEWNRRMLSDTHLKVQHYEANSSKIFPNTNINGGIVITYRNTALEYGAIENFIVYDELRSIKEKVKEQTTTFVSEIISAPESFKFTDFMHKERPEVESLLSSGHKYDVTSNVFDKLTGIIFFNEKPNDGNAYIQMFGLENTKRCQKWIRQEYISDNSGTLNKWKVLVSKANGASGTLAEAPARMISSPTVIGPSVGFTQTFISMGWFDSITEAKNAEKYIRTKFARALLGILKITQDCRAPKWRYVPVQDFTNSSDIDWTAPITRIDEQLFEKYELSKNEIAFINNKLDDVK